MSRISSIGVTTSSLLPESKAMESKSYSPLSKPGGLPNRETILIQLTEGTYEVTQADRGCKALCIDSICCCRISSSTVSSPVDLRREYALETENSDSHPKRSDRWGERYPDKGMEFVPCKWGRGDVQRLVLSICSLLAELSKPMIKSFAHTGFVASSNIFSPAGT